jgi:uncharacterized protein (TIGR02391 family)
MESDVPAPQHDPSRPDAGLTGTTDATEPEKLDSDLLWSALSAHAERGSPLARSIEGARSDLADRGMLRSGIAARRAMEVATEHGLAWEDESGAFGAAYLVAPRLSEDQQALLDVTAELFQATNEWPEVRRVTRQLVRGRGISLADELVASLPRSLGHTDGQTVVLNADGLAASPRGASVLAALVAFARRAADAYLGDAEPPTISTVDVAHELGLDEDISTQLSTLLRTESFFLGSGHGTSEGWEYEVTANAALFEACQSIDDYLRVRREVTRPRLAVQTPHLEEQATEAPTRRLALDGLHNAVIESAGDLYADGYYSQAVFEALKALESRVHQQSGVEAFGRELMDRALKGEPPPIDLRHEVGRSGADEQEGFRFIFMGAMQGIRNPKGHGLVRQDDSDGALEYLALVSLLFRRLDDARERAVSEVDR